MGIFGWDFTGSNPPPNDIFTHCGDLLFVRSPQMPNKVVDLCDF